VETTVFAHIDKMFEKKECCFAEFKFGAKSRK